MSPLELIAAIKDIVLAFAAAVTACVAVLGLSSWRREQKGKAQFEVARNLIRVTYKLRDELQYCRNPRVSGYEFPEGSRGGIGGLSPAADAEEWGLVYKNRWEPVQVAIQEFDSHTLEAEALWGETIKKSTDNFRKCASELRNGIEAFLSDKASGGEDFKADKEFGVKIRSIVAASPNHQDNDLSEKIASAVCAIEHQIRPHLRRGR